MLDDAIEVQTKVLRGCADDLASTAYRLGHGLGGLPGLTVAAPEWAAGAALAALESAVHGWLGLVGTRTAETAGGLRAAADGYDAADERAAGRLARTDTAAGPLVEPDWPMSA